MKRSILSAALLATLSAFACSNENTNVANESSVHTERSETCKVEQGDTIEEPTIMKDPEGKRIQLKLNSPVKGTLSKKSGWHDYSYIAAATGLVAVRMQSNPSDQKRLWTYLKIIRRDEKETKIQWVGIGNNKTNLTEVVVPMEKGFTYDVIATSQDNSTSNDVRACNPSTGGYNLSLVPLTLAF
jgi:hypothetical protein